MKTYNVITGTDRSQSTFMLGHTIGSRLARHESLIVVVADPELLPDQLRGLVRWETPNKALVICHGVTRVDECVDHYKKVYGDQTPNIHIIYWMPGLIKYKQDAGDWLPVEITSDIIKRQIARPDVKTITLFVE